MTILRTGVSIAAAAAVVAITAVAPTVAAAKGSAKVHCYGVNTCKGTSDCKTAKNDCRGQNDCKGQGFKELTAKACKTAGGSLTAPNKVGLGPAAGKRPGHCPSQEKKP
jgi:hypothetical protein